MTNQQKILNDIATRTNGDIYIGVVGPVRSGKSTFITRFMQKMVVPKIEDKNEAARVVDELPQSADGVGIMTTQPKFVPAKAVQIRVADNVTMRVRMVDCVGFLVPGATGHMADGKVRNVKTPWSDTEMSFERAAEVGTKKVIREHSTIAVVMTTDGTITELTRESYVEAEERVIAQLKKHGKPFIVVVNSRDPNSAECKRIAAEIASKHEVTVVPMNAAELSNDNINQIFSSLLAEFGVSGFRVTMPRWMQVLGTDNEIIAEALEGIRKYTASVKKLSDNNAARVFEKSINFRSLETTNIDVASGVVTYNLVPKEDLYFRVLGELGGVALHDEAHLVGYLRHMGAMKAGFEKIRVALDAVGEHGYGVVEPGFSEFNLEAPQLFKSGKNHGIRFRATAPSLHIVRVDVQTEVSPAIGTREHSEDMLKQLKVIYDEDRNRVWQTPIFGKSLESIIREGIAGKTNAMPQEAKRKMKRTLTKIVNNGRGGVICILL